MRMFCVIRLISLHANAQCSASELAVGAPMLLINYKCVFDLFIDHKLSNPKFNLTSTHLTARRGIRAKCDEPVVAPSEVIIIHPHPTLTCNLIISIQTVTIIITITGLRR